MKLLSKYKESYDAMLATGVGDLTWVRKPELAKLPDSLVPHCISKSKSLNLEIGQGTEMTGYFILGKKGYPFVAHCLPTPCKDDLRNLTQQALSGEWTFLFSALACKRYCQDKKLKGARETYLRNAHDWAAITLNESELDSPIGLVFWGANVSSPIRTAIYIKDMVFSLFTTHNLWSQFSLVEVYQAIYMFLANKTTKENEVVTVENDTRIQQHGFDLKTSFRKSKGK
jgi:hypothetical protein